MYKQTDPRVIGSLAMVLCGIIWSTAGLFIKLLDWNPLVISGMRSLFAAMFLVPARFAIYGRQPVLWRRPAFWLGGVFYALTMMLFVIANKLTSSANAIILQYTAPVWTAVFGWFIIREKPAPEQWAAMVMVLGGMYVIFGGGMKMGNPLGNVVGIICGICYGLTSVFLRKQKDAVPLDSMWLSNAILGVAMTPFYVIHAPDVTAGGAFSILFLGFVQIGVASLLYGYAVKKISAVNTMLIATVEPLLNPVWVFVVTGEAPSIYTLYGGAVILAAVILAGPYRPRRRPLS